MVRRRVYYALVRTALPPEVRLTLGYIVHVEAVWDAAAFDRLLSFCREYRQLTGGQVICALMTGANPLIRQRMADCGVDDAEYTDRVCRLGAVARLGYHGHFWFRTEDAGRPEAEVMWNNYLRSAVEEQFRADLAWFEANGLDHHGVYAGGWWFVNRDVHRLLLDHRFTTDFSCSKSRWFRNQYLHRMMRAHGLRCGEPFLVSSGDRALLCIQNLIGCHQTPFPEDFVRNVTALMDPDYRDVIGVVNTHDYDLNPEHTLGCLQYLARTGQVTFAGLEELREQAGARVEKAVPLPQKLPRPGQTLLRLPRSSAG